ncbi:MAG: polysaccharide biosynthesis C-terminal domain-containing protein [Elusimicrobia bacterium]|nr:polysaccharide biosynthesis C-terminal domain-containing protein [Elusimicrobiota bacterium]
MKNKLAQNFKFFSLIKFSLPTMIMVLFASFYTTVDGMFVARYVNTAALSAINLMWPIFGTLFAISCMFASGGSALVAKKMGEQKNDEAKANFSLIVIFSIIFGIIFSTICLLFLEPIIYKLGANEIVYNYCRNYISPILMLSPFCILQMIFHSFFIAAGKPKTGLFVSLIGGTCNIIFDYIFIVILEMGITGAAYATVLGFIIQSSYGILYFTFKKKGTLFFVKPILDMSVVFKSCYNGVAEFIGNFAVSITTFLFNIEMMKYLGVDGVAAITIVFYSEFILTAIFYGYASGVAPIFSYNYGSQNSYQLKNIFKISMKFVVSASVIMYLLSIFAASYVINIFAAEGSNVFNLALKGFFIFAISFIFTGVNIFAASLFTAFSNGKVAAILMMLRTFVLLSIAILLLPKIFNVNGIWLAVPIVEFLSILLSIFYLIKYRKIYNYL